MAPLGTYYIGLDESGQSRPNLGLSIFNNGIRIVYFASHGQAAGGEAAHQAGHRHQQEGGQGHAARNNLREIPCKKCFFIHFILLQNRQLLGTV